MPTPSKFNAETQERICQLVRLGIPAREAAEAAGISERTLHNWQERRVGFRRAVEQARAEAEASLVGRVQKAAQAGSWRVAAWMLERQWPERWAPVSDRERLAGDLDRELDRILRDAD